MIVVVVDTVVVVDVVVDVVVGSVDVGVASAESVVAIESVSAAGTPTCSADAISEGAAASVVVASVVTEVIADSDCDVEVSATVVTGALCCWEESAGSESCRVGSSSIDFW
jgi:hypothetical protein